MKELRNIGYEECLRKEQLYTDKLFEWTKDKFNRVTDRENQLKGIDLFYFDSNGNRVNVDIKFRMKLSDYIKEERLIELYNKGKRGWYYTGTQTDKIWFASPLGRIDNNGDVEEVNFFEFIEIDKRKVNEHLSKLINTYHWNKEEKFTVDSEVRDMLFYNSTKRVYCDNTYIQLVRDLDKYSLFYYLNPLEVSDRVFYVDENKINIVDKEISKEIKKELIDKYLP